MLLTSSLNLLTLEILLSLKKNILKFSILKAFFQLKLVSGSILRQKSANNIKIVGRNVRKEIFYYG